MKLKKRDSILAAICAAAVGVGAYTIQSSYAEDGATLPVSSDAGSVRAVPNDVRPALASVASDFGKAAIADGQISAEEKAEGARLAFACMAERTAGIEGVTVAGSADDRASVRIHAPTKELLDQAVAEVRKCDLAYYVDVATAWGVSGSYARLQEVWSAIGACMAEKGADLPLVPNWGELYEAAQASDDPGMLDDCRRDLRLYAKEAACVRAHGGAVKDDALWDEVAAAAGAAGDTVFAACMHQ